MPKKSYILLFDPSTQKATLEPLASTYTFNLASKNGANISKTYQKIYPRKQKDDVQETPAGDDLFDEAIGDGVEGDPDPDNPYDFRHFLSAEKQKRGDESEYNVASSPDYRTGTGSALNTPQFTARKPAAAATTTTTKTKKPATSKAAKALAQAARKPLKRKSPEPEKTVQKKAPAKTGPPAVRLERRATTQPKPEPAKPARKAAAPPPSSKIKSAEIVHSSDESDADADAEPEPEPEPELASSPPRSPTPPPPRHHSPSPEPESDEDEEMEDVASGPSGLELEIEVPDARPASKPRHTALASLGLGQNLGLGYLKSPSNGPISLASAANSVEGSPNPHHITPRKNRGNLDDEGVIDFGDTGGHSDDDEDAYGEAEDGDVEPMDIGPPAQTRRVSVGGAAVDEQEPEGEEEDPLYKEMMMGLAGGESSEESEEE